MAVTEEARNDLYNHLQETMGRDRARTLMEMLPPLGWGDVATKQDLERLEQTMGGMATKVDLAELKTELKTEIGELRADMKDLRAELYKVVTAQTLVLLMAMAAVVGAFR